MARKSRMSILKRQREVKKAEKAALKREKRAQSQESEPRSQVATQEDLEDYGVETGRPRDEEP